MRGVLRTLAVLEALNKPGGATVVELSRTTRISRPALYRMLEALKGAGYVAMDRSGEHYRLTAAIRGLSQGFTDQDWVTQIAEKALQQLQKQVIWPTDLGIYQGDCMVLAATTRPASPMTLDRGAVGQSFPMLACATGLAYLAFCPDDEREEILRALEHSDKSLNRMAIDRRQVDRLISSTRDAGFGWRSRTLVQESNAIAVPVQLEGRVYGCVNITVSAAMTVEEAASRFLDPLRETAAAIARRLKTSQAVWTNGAA